MESGLRAAIDRDPATIARRQSAANHLIQALSITQAEHTGTLDRLTERVESLAGEVGRLGEGLSTAHAKLDRLIAMIEQLIAKGD